MKLSGIDYFMTTKLSWSEYNLTPYDTFLWKGIDGTKVLTHFSPSREYFEAGHGEGHEGLSHYTTYNALIQPSQIAGGWKRFQQKGIDDHFLVSKREEGERTFSEVRKIDGEGRIKEIARLLSGKTSDSALVHARELLEV